jgi:hypothetical protein
MRTHARGTAEQGKRQGCLSAGVGGWIGESAGVDLATNARDRFDPGISRRDRVRAAATARPEALLLGSFRQAEENYLLAARLA